MTKIMNSFLKKTPHIDFIKIRWFGFILAFLVFIGSIVSLSIKGLDYGIDFKGGLLIEIQSHEPTQAADLRARLETLGLEDLTIQSIGQEGTSFLIYTTGTKKAVQTEMETYNQVKELLGEEVSFRRVEMVGPTIGQELIKNSVIATALAILSICIYIAVRFEWPFALTSMVGLTFVMTVIVGFCSFFGVDFNMTIVAAIMSLAGYSVNDTVVTFDRVRDNLKKYHRMPIDELLNKSINETLSRTLLTSLSTILMLVVLLFFGGETLFGFSLVFLVGIFIGTYASIFIAVQLLRLFDLRKISSHEGSDPYAAATAYEKEAQKLPLQASSCKNCAKHG